MGSVGENDHKSYLENSQFSSLDEYDEQILNDAQIQSSASEGRIFTEFDRRTDDVERLMARGSTKESTLNGYKNRLLSTQRLIMNAQRDRSANQDKLQEQYNRVESLLKEVRRRLEDAD